MIASLAIMALGAIVLGAALGYASIKFRVEGDPLVEKIEAILPQTQCGQCGFPGCKPYAIQRRAHWCAPPHVSIATTVPAGTCATHNPNASRLSSCRDCTRPVALIVQTETQTSPNPRQWL